MALDRKEVGDSVVWTTVLNGERCVFVTNDHSLVVTERGTATEQGIGVELVDQHGKRLAWSVRYPQ